MVIHKELFKIAKRNKEIEKLAEKLSDNLRSDLALDDLDLSRAYFIDGCKERDGHLYNKSGERIDKDGLVDDEYYCTQHVGYCEDDFYGTLYFKTSVRGRFVAVPFQM